MTPSQIAAAVIAASESIRAAETSLDADAVDAARSCLHAAQAALAVLSEEVEAALPTDEDEQPKQATDDPATCGHPETFDLPGQTMCQSCGASQLPNGTWAVL